GIRLLACLIVAPRQGYDEPGFLSYAIRSFYPTSADGLQNQMSEQFPIREYLPQPDVSTTSAIASEVFGRIRKRLRSVSLARGHCAQVRSITGSDQAFCHHSPRICYNRLVGLLPFLSHYLQQDCRLRAAETPSQLEHRTSLRPQR